MDQWIGRTRPNGAREVKKLVEVEEHEANDYSFLGQATGVNIIHCFGLGDTHKELFWERVYGYRIVESKMNDLLTQACSQIGKDDSYITICFYEKKPVVVVDLSQHLSWCKF